jgi:hypothetical protein
MREPVIVFLSTSSLVLLVTFLVLYWNWAEVGSRRPGGRLDADGVPRLQGVVILDHWGKRPPSREEIQTVLLAEEEEGELSQVKQGSDFEEGDDLGEDEEDQ